MKLVKIKKSTNPNKKLMAVFKDKDKTITTHFGAAGYSDYTIHKDPDRKKRYIKRHKVNQNWKDPTTAGALSRYILWEKTSLREAIKAFKKRFKI